MGSKGRWVSLPIGAMVVFVVALGIAAISTAGRAVSGVSVTLVDAKDHGDTVTGSPPTAAPGSVVALAVKATLGSGERWYATSWSIGGGDATCVNHADHSTGTATEYIQVTLPEKTPSPAQISVQLFPNNACTGAALATAGTPFKIGTPTDNNVLRAHCDTRVALVLDESGSIGSTQGAATAVRNGAKAFASGLVGTGAELAVVGFSTNAATIKLGSPPQVYNTVTDAYVSGPFTNYVNQTYNPSGWTNWQDALEEVAALSPQPELVVFLTDGDPTARNTPTGAETNFPDGSYSAMNPAFLAANALKSQGVHIFMMGVGSALTNQASLIRLRAISGPVQYPQNPLLGADYTVISDFGQLQDALAVIGRALCSVRVDVQKLVDNEGTGKYVAENGWTISGTATVSAPSSDSYRWLAPGVVQGPPSGGNTRQADTVNGVNGDPGHIYFAWKPSDTSATSQIVVNDVGKPGYHFARVTCTKNGDSLAVGQSSTVTLSGLAINDDAACVFENQIDRGSIKVVKHFVGPPVQVSLLIDNEVKKTSSDGNFDTGVVNVGIGNRQVAEDFGNDAVAALYDSTYSCSNGKSGAGVIVQGGVDIANGDAIVCTFTNTRKDLDLLVDKIADPTTLPEPGGQVTFRVEVVNKSDAPVTLTSLKDSVYGDLDAASPDDQHSWVTSSCQVGTGIPLTAYNGRVLGEDTYVCQFVGTVSGGGATAHRDTVTSTITDAAGGTKSADATAVVNITDVLPSISVTKTVDPGRVQDSGTVTYTAVVTNTSTVDPLNVDRLTDSIEGDLIDGPTKAQCKLGGAVVALPHILPVGESFVCTFQVSVSASQSDTLTASGTDPEGNRVQDADAAVVVVGITPPPPPPAPPVDPAPSPEPVPPNVDLAVTKIAPRLVFLNNLGLASFDYAIQVSTSGIAPGTTLSDPAPQGIRFTRIVRQPTQGSCTIANAGKGLTCTLGDLVAGQSVDIAVRVVVAAPLTSTKTVQNTAVANCKPTSGVPCTARGTATTRLVAPFLPPTGCNTILTNKLVLKANGAAQPLVIRVGRSGRPVSGATVVLRGPGIHLRGNTGSSGLFRTTVSPRTAGVLTVGLHGSSACSVRRIGLVSPATPSVTG